VPTPIDLNESLYDYAEAARQLNVKRSWLETAVQQRKVPHHRLGRLVRFTTGDLAEILATTGQPAVTRRRR
jgi:excisionase family DNA binding protein